MSFNLKSSFLHPFLLLTVTVSFSPVYINSSKYHISVHVYERLHVDAHEMLST